MKKNLSLWTHDENGLDYRLVGDYYIPLIIMPEERRHIGRWGRMYQEYLQEASNPDEPAHYEWEAVVCNGRCTGTGGQPV